MARTHVVWTSREWQVVAEGYRAYMQELRGQDLCEKAQEGLEPARRRNMKSASNMHAVRTECKRIISHLKDPLAPHSGAATATPAPSPTPAPAPVVVDAFSELPAAFRLLAAKIADEVAHAIFQGVKGRLHTLATEFVRDEALPRPRVLVVGPIERQQRLLEGEFSKVLDLRFVASHDKPHRIKEIAPGCAKAVLWTNYINHSHQEMLKNVFVERPGDKIYVTGGMESVREKLLELGVQ